MNSVRQKPPPKTAPRKITIKKTKTPKIIVDIQAEVLADAKSAKVKGGETTCTSVGKLAGGKLYSIPGYSWIQKGGLKFINKLNGPAEIKCTIRIQTLYNPKANPEDVSAYGRGTTPEDEKSGNVSLGFHEYCHRNDYIKYLQTTGLPDFGGKAGMSEQQYIRAQNSFAQAMDSYFKEMVKYSHRLTDEVGYKKSTFEAKGPRP